MPDLSSEAADFITELDAAVEAHMDWTRRVLRCVVLHTSPGEDVLAPMSHTLCRFGRWFESNQGYFEKLDAQNTYRLGAVHQSMHDAIQSICANVLAGQRGKSTHLEAFEQTQTELIKLLANFKTQFLANAVRNDPLTGLPLRHGINNEFIQFQKYCKHNNILFYIVLIDIDHFKSINDHYGHQTGDIALRHIANTMNNIVRPREPLYRFGGEEFLLLMQCQTHEEAASAAQRFVDAVRNSPVPIPQDKPLTLTVTLGLACVGDDETMNSAVERSDRVLYEGKRAGRNRYVIADA